MTNPPQNPASVPWYRNANALLAVAGTAAIVALHFYFLARVGGLWRDEVNSVNLAQGPLDNIFRDSFPLLFPMLLRGWSFIGLGDGDTAVRLLGVFLGLTLVTFFWVAAWWTRRVPPFWSLAFMALNAWVIYFSASLRAYGLGSALVALCAGAGWRFTHEPNRKTWAIFALTCVLCVQTLYQNCVFVAAICAGACAVFLCQKRLKPCVGVFLAGLTGAISMLPYYTNIASMPQGASPLRIDFDNRIALANLDTLIAYPLSQFFWLWPVLAVVVFLYAIAGLIRRSGDYRALFASVSIIVAVVMFYLFLRLANFPVQPWYFLPLVALTAACVDAALPRPAGKLRAGLYGVVAATAGISAVFGIRVLDYRFTNVDQFARKISAAADKHDLVVVTPWQNGITFSRYFKAPCPWTTVPPLMDHKVHRFDIIQKEMADPNVMQPVFDEVESTLKSGNTVWFVGGINRLYGTNAPGPLPAPPLPHTGWHETPYALRWNDQLGWFVRENATNIEVLDKGEADDVSLYERSSLEKVTGWKNLNTGLIELRGGQSLAELDRLAGNLKIGMTKAEVEEYMGKPDNSDTNFVWFWFSSASLSSHKVAWVDHFNDDDGRYLLFYNDKLISPLLKNTEATPWEYLKTAIGASNNTEVELLLGSKPRIVTQ